MEEKVSAFMHMVYDLMSRINSYVESHSEWSKPDIHPAPNKPGSIHADIAHNSGNIVKIAFEMTQNRTDISFETTDPSQDSWPNPLIDIVNKFKNEDHNPILKVGNEQIWFQMLNETRVFRNSQIATDNPEMSRREYATMTRMLVFGIGALPHLVPDAWVSVEICDPTDRTANSPMIELKHVAGNIYRVSFDIRHDRIYIKVMRNCSIDNPFECVSLLAMIDSFIATNETAQPRGTEQATNSETKNSATGTTTAQSSADYVAPLENIPDNAGVRFPEDNESENKEVAAGEAKNEPLELKINVPKDKTTQQILISFATVLSTELLNFSSTRENWTSFRSFISHHKAKIVMMAATDQMFILTIAVTSDKWLIETDGDFTDPDFSELRKIVDTITQKFHGKKIVQNTHDIRRRYVAKVIQKINQNVTSGDIWSSPSVTFEDTVTTISMDYKSGDKSGSADILLEHMPTSVIISYKISGDVDHDTIMRKINGLSTVILD